MGRRYQFITRLEEGALAEHFRAKVEPPGWGDVFIKLYLPRANEPAFAEAVAEAAARTRALNHPQAIGYDEVGTVAGRLAAVRPYAPGYSLGDVLRRLTTKEAVLPPALALHLVTEVALAVAAAHAAGWAHGAITPGNILLCIDGRVRVTDFGALKALSASDSLRPLIARGRHAYRAPETKEPGAAAPGADVYSLGAIAYELLTLREVAASRGGGLSTKRDALPAPSRVERRLNARIDPVIMRALEPAATRRYRSALELVEALRGLVSVLGHAAGQAEAVRFVKDLFPNEVTIGGIGGPLPCEGSFELGSVVLSPPGPVAASALVERRTPFTCAVAPWPAESEVGPESVEPGGAPPVEGRVASLAVAPEAAARHPSSQDWIAPPGVMSQAPRLARNRRDSPAPEASAEDLPVVPDPVQVELTPTVPGLMDSPLRAEELEPKPGTDHDWHPPPPREPEPAPRPANHGGWALAVLVSAGLAASAAWLVSGRTGIGLEPPVGVALWPERAGAPAPAPMDPVPRSPVRIPSTGTLSIDSDVPAAVFIDGVDVRRSAPVAGLPLAPGVHVVLLVHGDRSREQSVLVRAGETVRIEASFAPPARGAPQPAPSRKPAAPGPRR